MGTGLLLLIVSASQVHCMGRYKYDVLLGNYGVLLNYNGRECPCVYYCQVHKGLSRETSSYGLIDRIGAQVAGLTPRSQASLGAKPQAEGEGEAESGVD